MVRDLVDPRTGQLSRVLERLARPRGGSLPTGGLDAFADIARNPGHNVGRLFSLARAGATPYRPALRPTERPDAWTLALRFFGDGRTMNGPGNMAIDARGNVWATDGYKQRGRNAGRRWKAGASVADHGGGLNKPLGVGADIEGNRGVANSGFADVPCPTGGLPRPNHPSSLTLISSNGRQPQPREITGGGLTAPWGVAVDGHDNVWVANFSGQRLSEFCGKRPSQCPHGTRTGQPISPSTGYGFDGLVRNTGVQIDPSGNVWVANNWKSLPLPHLNPGGYQIVAFIGLAGPIRTPLIGPPRPL
jgi:hypothetical protein